MSDKEDDLQYSETDSESDYESNEVIDELYQQERQALNSYYMVNFRPQDIQAEGIELKSGPPTYVYPGLHLLQQDDLESYTSKYDTGTIHLCGYYVNKTRKTPFLEFIMRKYDKNHEKKDALSFTKYNYTKNYPITIYSNFILESISKAYKINDGMYEYKGFIQKDNQFYVFYDFSDCSIKVQDLNRDTNLWLITMDEIMNHRKVCNFPIDKEVTDFFTNEDNLELCYLTDTNNNIYETPTIAYSGTSLFKLDYMAYFGTEQTIQNEYLEEPQYYYTDYQTSFKMAGWPTKEEDVEETKGGIVRFALFLGYMKIHSQKDETESCDYDSVYINKNGHPIWALKTNERQCSLSCHYIDKTVLGKEWDENEEYYVI